MEEDIEYWEKICLLVVKFLVMIVGTVGNILTLAAITYVKFKYPTEFLFLQFSVTKLLINLSVCDLIYCMVGLPHMIHGQLTGKNMYVTVCHYILQCLYHSML